MIDRHGARQPDDRGLRGRIGGQPAGPQRRYGGNIDDCAAACGPDHGGNGVFGEQEHALDVDLHHVPVLFRRLVDDAPTAADADIVVEKIQPPPAIDAGLDQRLAVGLAGDVAADRRRRAAFHGDHLHRAFGERYVAIRHQHLGTLACQQNGCGPAVADAVACRTAAADNRNLAGQTGIVLWSSHRFFPVCRLTIATQVMGEKGGALRFTRDLSARWPIP